MSRSARPSAKINPPAIRRRGGAGTTEPNEISLDGLTWSKVTRTQRNEFLVSQARAGASLRDLRDRVRPPISLVGISKILAGEALPPRPRGGRALALTYLPTGIGPVDALRQVASSIPGLTIAEIVDKTKLTDWSVRELLIESVDPQAVIRGVMSQAMAVERIARVCCQASLTLRRPRDARSSSLLVKLAPLALSFTKHSRSHWATLFAATGIPLRTLKHLIGEGVTPDNGKGFFALERVAKALGYEWDLSHQMTGR